MRDDAERLRDMLEAIDKIQARTIEGREAFAESDLLQVWVIYHLQILGEAADHVSQSVRLAHTEIPWPNMVGMRHILIHGYFQIDVDIVWRVVEQDLPTLKRQVVTLLADLGEG